MGCVLGKRAVPRDLPTTAHSVSGDDRSSIAAVDSAAPPPPLFIVPKNPSGWPAWLVAVAGEALQGWTPRRADTFQKLSKIGSGTYSNVYKARDLETGRVVALKKVRFDAVEPESVRFMAREISLLRRLDHPNVVKLEGLVTSRVSPALYLIFEYMEHDLAGLVAAPGVEFSESQIKCYMQQLLCGLEHCHSNGVLHRDIKGSNLLIDNEGILKIADFGLASTFDPDNKQPMTSRVVTLWYRAPELLLGATYYGVGIDLWSAGCILAELLLGKPILPGRTEVEQLHKIFKLCGSPSEKYWKKNKLPHATIVKPQQNYKRCISEMFKDFPQSSMALIDTLLSIDPEERGTATSALSSSFFGTEPYACDPSSLPQYPPSKEMDAKLRDEKARRQKAADRKGKAEVTRKQGTHRRRSRAVPAPEANAELKTNLDRRRWMNRVNVTSKSEKFPPPHQDGAVGFQLDMSNNGPLSFVTDASFASSIFEPREDSRSAFTKLRGLMDTASKDTAKMSINKENQHIDASHVFVRPLKPTPIGKLTELERNTKIHRRTRGKELEVFGGGK